MRSLESRQWVSGYRNYQVADTTVVLVAAVAGKNLRITSLSFGVTVTAAQAVAVEGTDGTDVLQIPISAAVGSLFGFGPLFSGVALSAGAGLQISTSGAGVAGNVTFEGYYDS